MKIKLLLALFLGISTVSLSQEATKLKSTSYSSRFKNDYGRWSEWSKWETTEVLIVVKEDRISIYSKRRQEYDVIKYNDKYIDPEGDTVLKMSCVDQDGDLCTLRLISRKSGTLQLYVDFSDIMWVYNVKRV